MTDMIGVESRRVISYVATLVCYRFESELLRTEPQIVHGEKVQSPLDLDLAISPNLDLNLCASEAKQQPGPLNLKI